MFESDDFDQVLSQFEFPEVAPVEPKEKKDLCIENLDKFALKTQPDYTQVTNSETPATILAFSSNNTSNEHKITDNKHSTSSNDQEIKHVEKAIENYKDKVQVDNFVSPKHAKRKIIKSYFDHKTKRKFPGPAGLLTGALEEPKDESICQIELLSQDIDCTQHIQRDLFNSPIWTRLLSDTHSWKLHGAESIKIIKQQALSGNLRRRKAQIVIAFIEAVDRSAIDPLIILRDTSGTIKCTLHRDAWSTFSSYIVSEYCAIVLRKPTVLTTGAAFKKHYLNITLSNILAIYSSAVLNEDENKTLPDGYTIAVEQGFTMIKTEFSPNLETFLGQNSGAGDLFDGLDSIFSDDVF